MGWAMAISRCGACGKIFGYNPRKVPSLNNVPFCKECVEAANPIRVKKGLAPIHFSRDAYEPVPEEEI